MGRVLHSTGRRRYSCRFACPPAPATKPQACELARANSVASAIHVEPDRGAGLSRTKLHEITQLVRDPQSASADLFARRSHTSDHRVGEESAVAYVAHE